MTAYFILSLKESKQKQKALTTTTSKGTDPFLSLEELKPCAISGQNIEKMKDKFRTHRAAFDFDRSFCLITVICELDDTSCTIPRLPPLLKRKG